MGKPILRDNLLYLIVFGTGTGESVILRLPGEQGPVWCVVDSCSVANENPAERILDEYKAQLSLLVLSHPHNDHAGRFVNLFSKLPDSGTLGASWPHLREESWESSLEARTHYLKVCIH